MMLLFILLDKVDQAAVCLIVKCKLRVYQKSYQCMTSKKELSNIY